MRAKDRRASILQLLQSGVADVEELSSRLTVSASTIRRDLARLSDAGKIARTYGGAIPIAPSREQSLGERERIAVAEKFAIAAMAETVIQEGETIFLDAGTTIGALARRIRHRKALKVVTTGLTAVIELLEATDIEVMLVGGLVRRVSMGLVGPLAEGSLRSLSADRAFVSADGVVAGRGLCEATLEQASIKSELMARARDVYVLADASKLGRQASHAWAELHRPWTLITDWNATDEQLRPFEKLGYVRILMAERPDVQRLQAG
jgi:DeoR/GlpR family transcriptional regulator of sugar metabolism